MSDWVELRVVIPRSRVERLSQLAFEHGATGVQEAPAPGSPVRFQQPWDTEPPPLPLRCSLRAWFAPGDATAAAQALQEAVGDAEVERIEVQDEDWAESWKQHHHRVVVSERLRVAPPWEAVPGDLIIPPGNAFGTGDHPTTLACLGAIDRLAFSGGRVLDVGCGSGVLALAAAALGMEAVGVDIDPAAVESARENARLNNLRADFSTTALHRLRGPFDLVVANLYAEVLADLAPELIRLTGRHLVLAGVLSDRASLVLDRLSPPLAVVDDAREGEWLSVHLERIPG
ncbi:MAG: 50S ribosomal protein L11 methyltransferase [Alphaproteobacteria bacterium]|nr:50S ribosomal protein L11 methyltransferase [Alphaproteobacteria bacterium]